MELTEEEFAAFSLWIGLHASWIVDYAALMGDPLLSGAWYCPAAGVLVLAKPDGEVIRLSGQQEVLSELMQEFQTSQEKS